MGIPILNIYLLVNWVYYFHIIPVIAVFCIGGTILLLDIFKKLRNKLADKSDRVYCLWSNHNIWICQFHFVSNPKY